MKPKGITIADVAQRAQVSPASVSRYLNGVEGNLSAETAQRIAQVIEDLGYRPNAWARSLKTQRSGLIAAVVADLSNSYVPAVLHGIENITNSAGFSLLIANAQNNPDHESYLVERLLNQRVEGILLQPSSNKLTPSLRSLITNNIPLVLIDRLMDDVDDWDMVGLDNAGAIHLALKHLESQGYRQIVYVTDPPDEVSSRREREQTVLSSYAQWEALQIFVRRDNDPSGLIAIIDQMLAHSNDECTAVVCSNAVTALYAVKAIELCGYRIPQDMGLIMIDDPDWAPFVLGGITSVAQPTFDLGNQAAQRLVDKIQQTSISSPSHTRLSGSLVIRHSTINIHRLKKE